MAESTAPGGCDGGHGGNETQPLEVLRGQLLARGGEPSASSPLCREELALGHAGGTGFFADPSVGVVTAEADARGAPSLAQLPPGEADSEGDAAAKAAEIAELCAQLAELRSSLQAEIATARDQLEVRATAIERSIKAERAERNREYQELHAIQDSMWKQISARPQHASPEKQRLFQDQSGSTREFTGDTEDVFTLYDLVREALGDSTRLTDEIAQEREDRTKDMEDARRSLMKLDFRLNTLQALMRAAAVGASGTAARRRSQIHAPKTTLVQLASKDPQWNRLLDDPDRLFTADDVIDESYEKYLSEILPYMIKHNCTFKRAVGLAAEKMLSSSSDPAAPPDPAMVELTHLEDNSINAGFAMHPETIPEGSGGEEEATGSTELDDIALGGTAESLNATAPSAPTEGQADALGASTGDSVGAAAHGAGGGSAERFVG